MREYWKDNKDLILYTSDSMIAVHFLVISSALALANTNTFLLGLIIGLMAMFLVVNLANNSSTEVKDKLGIVAYFSLLGYVSYHIMAGATPAIISLFLLGWLANWFFYNISFDTRLVF